MAERKLWNEILQARDETRLQLHLAGMEARDAFDKLDTRVDAFARKAGTKLEKLGENIGDETKTILAEMRAEIDDVRAKFKTEEEE